LNNGAVVPLRAQGKMHQSLITKINIRGQRFKTLAFLSLPAEASAQAGPGSSSNLCPQGYRCPQAMLL